MGQSAGSLHACLVICPYGGVPKYLIARKRLLDALNSWALLNLRGGGLLLQLFDL